MAASSQSTRRKKVRRQRNSKRTPLSSQLPRSTPEAIQAFREGAPRLRLISVWIVLLVGIFGLSLRLAYLQLVIGDDLKIMAEDQQQVRLTPRASRRQIVDRQGNVIALDQVVYTLYVHPFLFKKPPEDIAEAIAPVLEKSSQSLLELFTEQTSGIQLDDDLSEETAKRLQALRLDGIELLPAPQRQYPQAELFSQITGYIDLAGEANAGVELGLGEQLRYDEPSSTEAAPLQLVTRDDLQLQLTIDARLQRIAQEALAETIEEYRAKRGAVIVMDARTGELLTLAVAPTYDPNRYYEADLEQFKNWAVSDLYEPGSTFKPINIAIALETGTIGPDHIVNDPGKIQVGPWPIQNVDYDFIGGRGDISVTDVLRYSSNVGMVRIMNALDRAVYFDWLEKLGLGETTGIEIPGETSGQLKDREQFVASPVESATTAFGQGFSLTPLQLVRLHGTLANSGKLVTPHVVRGLVNSDGDLTWKPEEQTTPRRIFSPQTTQQVLEMMREVVSDGTGAAAQVEGYQIAGKTGTAQKATEFGTYGNQRITSFVSIAPVSDPRYVVLAVIDEPQGENAYGGTVAAPIVKKMLESLVVIEEIKPDQSASQTNPPTSRPDSAPASTQENPENSAQPDAAAPVPSDSEQE